MNTIHLYFIDETSKSQDYAESLGALIARAARYRGVVTVGPSEYGVRVYAIGFRRCTKAFMAQAHKLPNNRRNYLI